MRKFQLLLAGLGMLALIMVSEEFKNHVDLENFVNEELTEEQKAPGKLHIVEHPTHWYQEGFTHRLYRWQLFYWVDDGAEE